jgi:dTDP-4-amino-4,6-dideoxygalactose transaminase
MAVLKMSGPGRHFIGKEEKKEIMEVLNSGHLFRFGLEGDPDYKQKVVSFEDEFKKHMGTKYCVATTCGTASLMTCLAALGIEPGDEIIVPGYTFIATISAVIYSRAIPILAEIDESLTIDPKDIEKKITKKTKAIIPVHMLGNPCGMDAIIAVAKKHNLFVIEDCAQAAGGSYKGKKLGSIGNMGAYSLNQMKVISSGDGGAVVTDNYNLYERAFVFHYHGNIPSRFEEKVGENSILGVNFVMNELTGAVALAQVRKLDTILSILRTKKKKLKDMIKDIPNIGFRRINDEKGELATILTLTFDNIETADKFAEKIGVKTVYHSGWHVYNNMKPLLGKKMPTAFGCPFECPLHANNTEYKQHMLPQTDDILSRSVNISIGVVDEGLGSSFGINVLSSDKEIESVAESIKKAMQEL